MRAAVRSHPVVAYAVLAYALSWAWWIPMAVRGDVVRAGDGWPTHLPGLLGPAVAAVVVTALADGAPGLRDLFSRMVRWRVGWPWWALVLGTAALASLGLVVALVTGDPLPAADGFLQYSGTAEIGAVGVVLVVFLVNGVGEETGWRGFAVDRLLPRRGLTNTALIVGIVWAGWHLPMFWIDETFRSMGVIAVGWAVGLIAASVVLAWIYVRTGRSILLVAAWHAAFNLTAATEATGNVVGVITTTLVVGAAVWILRREGASSHAEREGAAGRAAPGARTRERRPRSG